LRNRRAGPRPALPGRSTGSICESTIDFRQVRRAPLEDGWVSEPPEIEAAKPRHHPQPEVANRGAARPIDEPSQDEPRVTHFQHRKEEGPRWHTKKTSL